MGGLADVEQWDGAGAGADDTDEWEWEMERQVTALTQLVSRRREARALNRARSSGALRQRAGAELRTVELWRAVSCECVASFLYILVTCGAAGGAGVGASTSSVLLATALSSGCAIAALTLCFANISGAHVNPAVSCALCVRRLVSPVRCTLYVLAQCGGAIAGAALLYGATIPGYQGNLSAALSAWGATAAWGRFGVELVLTSIVVVAYFAAAERHWTGGSPLALGAAYIACGFVSMPYLNPARSLGPSFILSRWESHWVYWAGPLAGAITSGLLYELATRTRSRTSSSSPSGSSSAVSDDAFDRLADKPQPAIAAAVRPTYCAAERVESLYAGTKSLYCRSPPLTRANLHRSQSVYAKTASQTPAQPPPPGPLLPAQSLYPLRVAHNLAHAQNAHNNAHAAAVSTTSSNPRRPESVYGTHGARRGHSLQSDDSSYGSYAGGGVSSGGGGAVTVPRAPPSYRHY